MRVASAARSISTSRARAGVVDTVKSWLYFDPSDAGALLTCSRPLLPRLRASMHRFAHTACAHTSTTARSPPPAGFSASPRAKSHPDQQQSGYRYPAPGTGTRKVPSVPEYSSNDRAYRLK